MSQQTMTQQDEARLYDGAEVRAVEKARTRRFEGRAVPYGRPALINGLFVEEIRAGCFSKSLSESAAKLPLMMAHKLDEIPLGHLESWEERDDGLHGVWRVSDGEHADAAWESVRDGDMSGLSVHFRPLQDDWTMKQPPEFDKVTRLQARLMEISLCAVPTWQEARVTQTRTAKGGPVQFPQSKRWAEWLTAIR